MHESKRKLIVLTGPTAVGKTNLSIKLAKAVGGEIVSADSIQVYKHFDIGSAKVTKEKMQGVPHYLIDVLEPSESFSVADFKVMALNAMNEIYDRGHIPIITGGTGFYIQAVLNDIDFTENCDDGYRTELEKQHMEFGASFLHDMLAKIDFESAKIIHPNNTKRVIRALEFYHQTGHKISDHNALEREKISPYNFAYFVLNCDRSILYEQIDKRVDIMLKNGLIDEVKGLITDYGLTKDMVSMQGLGYKEIMQFLNDEITIEEAVYILKRDTRHFAKRQITWFKREKDVIWVNKDELKTEAEQLAFMMENLKTKEII